MRIANGNWACVFAVMLALVGCGGGGGGSGDVGSSPPPGGGSTPPPGGGTPPPGGGNPPPPPGGGGSAPPAPAPSGERKPILFVTQAPASGKTFTQIFAAFGNHQPDDEQAPRGGDLMIAYPPATADGAFELRNLTQEAGFGIKNGAPDTNPCGSNMVAVREPSVSWDAKTALVSMVVGCGSARWQIYEVSGLSKGDKVSFVKLAQPTGFNNVSPIYSPEGASGTEHIIFSSDMSSRGPDDKFRHLKNLDEYEMQPSTSGLFKLDRAGNVTLLHAAPSGAFTPIVDAFGRVIFTNWDHLDEDNFEGPDVYNYLSEDADAVKEDFNPATNVIHSVFPDRRDIKNAAATFGAHNMKVFLPWEINADGTDAETLNHIGRHEFGRFIEISRIIQNNPLQLQEHPNSGIGEGGPESMRMIREDPLHPGLFYSVYTPEFPLCGGGAVKTMLGAPNVRPKDMTVTDITDPKTYDGEPAVFHSPLPTATGELWAAAGLKPSRNGEDCTYRITKMVKDGAYFVPALNGNLTPGEGLTRKLGTKTVALWEWQAVEVRERTKPEPRQEQALDARELQAFTDVFGPDPNKVQAAIAQFREFLTQNNLAAIVSYNLTWRESADRQQPYNLRIRGSAVETKVNDKVTVLDIDHLQLFTAQQLRGNVNEDDNSRRVLAQPAKSIVAKSKVTGANLDVNVPPAPASPVTMPAGSVPISKKDGSMAALVEARRATTWQTIDSGELGDPLLRTDGRVRERMWLSFQPGEVRTCVACHGGSDDDVAQNGQQLRKLKDIAAAPDALVQLLTRYRDNFYTAP